MSEWQPMKTAPGGTTIRVKLKSGKEGFVIWTGGFLDEEGEDCGGWNWIGHNPPRSWTDGVCWDLNGPGYSWGVYQLDSTVQLVNGAIVVRSAE